MNKKKVAAIVAVVFAFLSGALPLLNDLIQKLIQVWRKV